MSKFFFLLLIIFISVLFGFLAGSYTKFSTQEVTTQAPNSSKTCSFLKTVQDEKISIFKSWENDEGDKFFCIVQQLDEPCDKDYDLSTCERFSIYNEQGKSVYEFKDVQISGFTFERFAQFSTQIVIESNGGGTDNFLTIVDNKEDKFMQWKIESDTYHRGGWLAMPEYRSTMKGAYFKPSQLIIIQQIGGADDSPSASVFRNVNNKFQKVGDISMGELGDFIEKQLSQKK